MIDIVKNQVDEEIKPIRRQLDKKELQSISDNVTVTDSEVNKVNELLKDESDESLELIFSHLVEFRHLIGTDYCKNISQFIIALKYVSYLSSGCTIVDSYCKSHSFSNVVQEYTLHQQLRNDNPYKEEIERSANLYAKSKLVVNLLKASDYPLHLIYSGYRAKALETLYRQMNNAPLAKDKIEAAKGILSHTTTTVDQSTNINLTNNVKVETATETYKKALEFFAEQANKMIANGLDTREIINLDVTTGKKDE